MILIENSQRKIDEKYGNNFISHHFSDKKKKNSFSQSNNYIK